MSQMNWLEILGWGQTEIEDLRYVAYSYIQQGIYDVALTFFDALTVLSLPTPTTSRQSAPSISKKEMDSKPSIFWIGL